MCAAWAALLGSFDFEDTSIIFHGEPIKYDQAAGLSVGKAVTDVTFSGGRIAVDIVFSAIGKSNSAEIMLYYDPATQNQVNAGLAFPNYAIRHWAPGPGGQAQWTYHAMGGDRRNLKPNVSYHVEAELRGSRVLLRVDGVLVAEAVLPFPIPQSQAGLFFMDDHEVTATNFEILPETPTVFVIMAFTSPYTELHDEVIKVICDDFHLRAEKADDTAKPGIVVAEIERQITEAKFVIAEVTPPNPNVYYEVGYAHAIKKPTILIADRSVSSLPFDVRPFRTLFYENTIAGKRKVEEGLKKYIKAILEGG